MDDQMPCRSKSRGLPCGMVELAALQHEVGWQLGAVDLTTEKRQICSSNHSILPSCCRSRDRMTMVLAAPRFLTALSAAVPTAGE